MTIVTLTRFPTDDKLRVHEIEVEKPKVSKKAFDKIVELTFSSLTIYATYLVDDNGRMIDSYIK